MLKLQIILTPQRSPSNLSGSPASSTPNSSVKRNSSRAPDHDHKFLHLTLPGNSLGFVCSEIRNRFLKLYPDESPLDIYTIQDVNECDLDPDFMVSDVFESNDIVRVIVNPALKTPKHNLLHPSSTASKRKSSFEFPYPSSHKSRRNSIWMNNVYAERELDGDEIDEAGGESYREGDFSYVPLSHPNKLDLSVRLAPPFEENETFSASKPFEEDIPEIFNTDKSGARSKSATVASKNTHLNTQKSPEIPLEIAESVIEFEHGDPALESTPFLASPLVEPPAKVRSPRKSAAKSRAIKEWSKEVSTTDSNVKVDDNITDSRMTDPKAFVQLALERHKEFLQKASGENTELKTPAKRGKRLPNTNGSTADKEPSVPVKRTRNRKKPAKENVKNAEESKELSENGNEASEKRTNGTKAKGLDEVKPKAPRASRARAKKEEEKTEIESKDSDVKEDEENDKKAPNIQNQPVDKDAISFPDTLTKPAPVVQVPATQDSLTTAPAAVQIINSLQNAHNRKVPSETPLELQKRRVRKTKDVQSEASKKDPTEILEPMTDGHNPQNAVPLPSAIVLESLDLNDNPDTPKTPANSTAKEADPTSLRTRSSRSKLAKSLAYNEQNDSDQSNAKENEELSLSDVVKIDKAKIIHEQSEANSTPNQVKQTQDQAKVISEAEQVAVQIETAPVEVEQTAVLGPKPTIPDDEHKINPSSSSNSSGSPSTQPAKAIIIPAESVSSEAESDYDSDESANSEPARKPIVVKPPQGAVRETSSSPVLSFSQPLPAKSDNSKFISSSQPLSTPSSVTKTPLNKLSGVSLLSSLAMKDVPDVKESPNGSRIIKSSPASFKKPPLPVDSSSDSESDSDSDSDDSSDDSSDNNTDNKVADIAIPASKMAGTALKRKRRGNSGFKDLIKDAAGVFLRGGR